MSENSNCDHDSISNKCVKGEREDFFDHGNKITEERKSASYHSFFLWRNRAGKKQAKITRFLQNSKRLLKSLDFCKIAKIARFLQNS